MQINRLYLITVMNHIIFNNRRDIFRRATSYAYACTVRSLSTPAFVYQPLFDLSKDTTTTYKKLTDKYVSTIELNGQKYLKVEPEGLRLLSAHAMTDIAHLLRPAHLQQLSNILKDPESTENDRFVALELLKNANIASNYVLPGCQDTGTAIVSGKRGQYVLTDGNL